MNDTAKPNNSSNERRNFEPKSYRFERSPNGKKLMRIRRRSRGEKREIKLTLGQIIKEFKKA